MAEMDPLRKRRKEFIAEVQAIAGDRDKMADLGEAVAKTGTREDGRICRIIAARHTLTVKLERFPKNPHAKRWRERLAEFDQALANFEQFGVETVPTGNPIGVNVTVPGDGANGGQS